MSKASSNTKISQKGAWSNGPPSASSSGVSTPTSPSSPIRPGSPSNASRGTHSRKPSQLSQQIGDGVAVSMQRGARPTHQSRGSVNFGTINDAGASNAPVSSSPASVPPLRSDSVMSFGQVPASPATANPPASANTSASTTASGTSAAAAPGSASKQKFDFKKLFQNSPQPSDSNGSSASPSPSAEQLTTSSSSSPSQPPPPNNNNNNNSGPPPFRPQGQQNGVPRSPVQHHRMPNGNNAGRPGGPPPQPNAGMPPPPNVPQAPIPGMPPAGQVMPHPGWPGGYYYDPNAAYMYGWGYMPPMQPQPQPGQPIPGQSPIPMSPRNQPPSLPPGTPNMNHAAPAPPGPPPPAIAPSHSASPSLSSVPLTPSSPASAQNRTLNPNTTAFVPSNRTSKISIKRADGSDFNFEEFRSKPNGSSSPVPNSPSTSSAQANRRSMVRIETEEAKKKRLAEQQEKEAKAKEAEDKKRREAEEKKKKAEEAERKKKEEEERERKKKEEAEAKKKKEEEDRKKKAEEEKKRKEEEAERKKKEEEEEAARKQKEKEEEEERKRKQKEEEEEARKQKEKEDQERKEAEEKKRKEEEAAAAVEEGEIKESPVPEPKKLGLRIDTETGRKSRPGPLDLSGAKKASIVAPLPSALSKAKQLDNLDPSMYPEGIKSPKIELNVNAAAGKFRYDRDFLLQFMNICKEKPDMLPPLDAIGLEPQDQNYPISRGGSGRHRDRNNSNASLPQRAASIGLGISGQFGKGGSGFGTGNIGNFSTAKTSDERFAASRSASVSGMPFNRQPQLTRTASQGGPGGHNSKRTRSQRGKDRGSTNLNAPAIVAPALEPVIPLQSTANAWNRKALAATADGDSPELVERKVKSLLNKLTMEKFDSISDQIISWANKSENEKDGRTLIQVIRLVFEKATDEAAWSEMYARLCRKMMEQISSSVQDDGIKNAEGKPIAGGQLFRKYLLNRCQEDFERGWVQKEATAAAAALKSTEDKAAQAANSNKEGDENGEVALYSEEYYAAQKAKRQGLGLIRFIGELFKLQMLTERIMHECVKKLLGNVDTPEEEEIESLCKLLTTVGHILDTPKAKAHMDVYFSRMQEMTRGVNVSSRMQFMLQDVIELRERKWINRSQVAAPTTLSAVHSQAAKDYAQKEKESLRLQTSMSRGGSRRGGDRGETPQVGPDGWSVAGGNAAPRPPAKAGDLSNFGKITKSGGAPMSFGPSSVFNKKDAKRESVSRTSSSSNMFSMLQSSEAAGDDSAGPSSKLSGRPGSRKPSVDLGSGGAGEASESGPPQRRKLALLPRTKPIEPSTPDVSRPPSEDGEASDAAPAMSEKEAEKKVAEDQKEFFAIRNIDEAESYFTSLPSAHHSILVEKFTGFAIESKASDAELVAQLFERATQKNLISSSAYETAFSSLAEFLEDVAIDAPKAYDLKAMIVKGVGLDEATMKKVASKDGSGKLGGLLGVS